MRRWPILAVALFAFQPRPSHAYRPFNATDAGVVAPGELELGPVGTWTVFEVRAGLTWTTALWGEK